MNSNIYKTQEGRAIVESLYKGILASYLEVPYESLMVPTKQAQTHVLRFGNPENPPLVMLHGSVSNSASWLGCLPDFVDDFCAYCVDIPGEPGLSEPLRCTLSSDEPDEWLASLLDGLGIEKAAFVSMSLGSWYALNFATHHPERVTALSMITSGGLVQTKTSFLLKAVVFMMLGKAGHKMLSKAIYYKTAVPDAVLDFQAIVSKHFNPVVEALPIFSDEQLKQVICPIQFFGGDHDALIDSVKTAERLKSLYPRAEVHLLPDTGHVIIDRFPDVLQFQKACLQSPR